MNAFGGGALSSHPTMHTPKTSDVYEYMSSKGVPQPEDSAYDNSVPRYIFSNNMHGHDPYYSLVYCGRAS